MKKLITLLFFSISLALWAQSPTTKPVEQNPNKLLELKFQQTYKLNQAKAKELSQKLGIPLRQKSSTGQIAEFYGFSSNGQMLFYETQNVGAGRSLSTNKVWPGGTTNTSLTGSGMANRLGEWDGGAVLVTHQEFGGRVTQVDGSTDLSDHATHVAGTLVAAGVDANAKGMAYQAPLKAYDWNNDESEMTSAAGAGMLVSNHSYGTICGWRWNPDINSYEWWGDASISQTEDYKFGFYDQQAANWDDIAYNNPFYLICKAAGNDRGDNISGGTSHKVRDVNFNWVTSNTARVKDGGTLGYDCISTYGCSKNVLTVGAVNKVGSSNNNNGYVNTGSVVMSSFSGWGPTDDGRIKPDVVGAGVDIYSTGPASNSAYLAGYNGTSMATPNVAGSILLVQQHFNNTKGRFMRASSLKGLIIHTADEAGTAIGPDYQHGWGLVNTAKAVKHITDSNYNTIEERVLANNATYTKGISSDGVSPLRVTICWTDIAGNPTPVALDPTTSMLINDLDIRLTRNSDNTVFSPYILNPSSPNTAATTGDNFRDNIEQIYIAAPTAGSYTISVSHKRSLGSAQSYSLIISGFVGKPSAAFNASSKNICTSQTVFFTDNSGGNPTSRTWYFPGGTPSSSTLLNPSVTYPNSGIYSVSLKVTNALGVDSIFKSNLIRVGGISIPFMETFESNSPTLADWIVQNPDEDTTWRLANTGGTTPGNTSYCLPFYNYQQTGNIDNLLSPTLSFKGYENVSLTFKHAYTNYQIGLTDSLNVYISTNCGNTFTLLKRLGEDGNNSFATKPLSTDEFIPTTANQWCVSNCNTINLSAYDGMSNVIIKFETVNGWNNNLYIDNISITGNILKPVTKFGTQTNTTCSGNSIKFIDSTLNSPTSWFWTVSGPVTLNSNLQNPSFVFNTPGQYSVKLKTSNAGGSDSLVKLNYLTILQTPGKPNIGNGGVVGICIGDTTTFTTDSVNNALSWTRNDTLILAENTSTFKATLAGVYKVISTAVNNCTSVSVGQNLLTTLKPTTPILTSNITLGAFCEGSTAILTSSAQAGNIWYKNNTLIVGATAKTYNTQVAGLFAVKTITNGCSSDTSIALQLNTKPKPVTPNITGNDQTNFRSIETYGITPTAGSSYNWVVTNGTPINGTVEGTIDVTWGGQPSGNVSVTETAQNGCKGDVKNLAITLTPKTAIESVSFLSGISVFPNPMYSDLTLAFEATHSEKINNKLINMIGQTVSEHSLNAALAGTQFTIDVSKLNAGIYFIELQTSDGSKQIKLVKK